MLWRLCGPDSQPLDFHLECVRSAWAALVPFGVVLVLVFFAVPGLPWRVPSVLRTFVTLEEAEALSPRGNENENENGNSAHEPTKHNSTLRRPLLFVSIGLLSTLLYLSRFSYLLVTSSQLPSALPSLLLSLSWLYTVLRATLKPPQTVPYDLFAVYTVLFSGAVLQLGGVYYERGVFGLPWPSVGTMLALWGNLCVTTATVCVVLGMPLALPGEGVKAQNIVSADARCSLQGRLMRCAGNDCVAGRLYVAVWMGHFFMGTPACAEGEVHDARREERVGSESDVAVAYYIQ